MINQKHLGKIFGIVIASIFIIGLAYVGFILYINNEHIKLIPVVFIIGLMLFLLIISLMGPRKRAIGEEKAVPYHVGLPRRDITNIGKDDSLHLLLTSKDCVFITTLVSEFKKEGIGCTVLDQYAGRMMKFLPDIEMKVMVSGKDYDRSLLIAKDIIEEYKH